MEQQQAKRIIEAILFVYGQSVALKRVQEVLPDLDTATVRRLVQELNDEYTSSGRVFHVQEVAGGYQMVTHQDVAPWVKKALERPKPDAVSVAAMETLAIIAYRQPITKAEMEAIRGVDVSASLETLQERQFVRVAGRKESPGRPFLYATTSEFLRHFGLKSLEALPEMKVPTVPEQTEAPAPALVSGGSGEPAAAGASTQDRPEPPSESGPTSPIPT